MAGRNIGAKGGNEGLDGIVPSTLERAEDRHQDGLREGSAITAIAIDDLANHHRKANFAFAVIVGGGDFGMFQESEQLLPVFMQSFRSEEHTSELQSR